MIELERVYGYFWSWVKVDINLNVAKCDIDVFLFQIFFVDLANLKNRKNIAQELWQVVNFINILRPAFTQKAQEDTYDLDCIFALSGSERIKAALRTLVKLTRIVNFINILRAAFVSIFFHQKVTPNCN